MGGCCSKKDDKKKKGDDEEGDKACIIGPNIMRHITLITLLVSDFDIIFTVFCLAVVCCWCFSFSSFTDAEL